MIEKALSGSKTYWLWVGFLGLWSLLAFALFVNQWIGGLYVTGMSRDIPWGLYIAQLTFLVGVAASAVMVVLPYYLHDYKAFGNITVLGEFLAIPAVIVAMLFVGVDMGRPDRLANILLHPSPNSPMFWDFLSVSGYLLLNLVIGFKTLYLKINGLKPPGWLKFLILLSIPWAVSIHTVTAFLYSGLAARPFWLSAIMAPRFLASAFACGPSLLILILFVLERVSSFRAERAVIDKLSQIVTYALILSIFFLLLEFFTVFYSRMPHHMHPFEYLLFGLEGKTAAVPYAWASILLTVFAATILLIPKLRKSSPWLQSAAVMTILGLWIDKGLNIVAVGFVPTPMEEIVEYTPTAPEILLTVGLYAFGALIFTFLCKIYLAGYRIFGPPSVSSGPGETIS